MLLKKDVYNAKIKNIEDKLPDITNLMPDNTTFNAKINEAKDKIPSITNLATTAAVSTVENKIPNFSDLVKKADYDAEIKYIKDKYFATSDYNKFTNNIFDEKITEKRLVNESGLNENKNISNKRRNKKIATKAELKAKQDKIIKTSNI